VKTRKQDQAEIATIVRALGASELEAMLYEGIVFVEGPDDVELLEIAFPETLARLKYRSLSGRAEVEKYIKKLQEEEKKNQEINLSYFIFDRDRKPAETSDTARVKVAQWNRYCLENFLIDPEILFDVIRREYSPKNWPQSLASAEDSCVEISQKQLVEITVWEVFKEAELDSPILTSKEVRGKSIEDVSATIEGKLQTNQVQYAELLTTDWLARFRREVNLRVEAKRVAWRNNW
jgi:hypothetical protein